MKSYLRIENTAENDLLDELVEQATSQAESLLGQPLLSEERTFVDVVPAYDPYGRHSLMLPVWPVASTPAPVTTDFNGTVINSSTYTLDSLGRLVANAGSTWSASPFSVVATVGLENHPSYLTRIEPQLRSLILGLAAVLYHQRNPNASSDSSGGGVSVSYANNEYGLPPHLYQIVMRLRLPRIR